MTVRPLRAKGAACRPVPPARSTIVAPDGSVYVASGDEHRVVHLGASGQRLGVLGPRLYDAYALAVAPDGTVYADDIGAELIRRISPGP